MPRRARRELSDGGFHITAVGVAGSLIFIDDFDRRRFALLLDEVSDRWGWEVIVWCLMGTHYHLVVRARREQMSHAVHRLNGLYAQGFNRRHERRGHLFQNRFSSWVIRDEEHLRTTIAYVLNNPVAAGLCAEAKDWLWSWSKVSLPVDVVVAAVAARAVSEGLSLGHVRKRLRRPAQKDDVDLAWAVDSDRQLLLDVGAPAGTGDDRQRARQLFAEHGEELLQSGKDPILVEQRHVDVRKE